MKMTLGAEPKKVVTLGVLLVVALVVFLMNSSDTGPQSSGQSPAASSTSPRPASTPSVTPSPADVPVSANRADRGARREFRPSPKPKRGEARPDPMTVDPTLRLDILAKLQQVNVEGMHRSIFDFGQAPAPPTPIVKAPKAPSPFIGPERPPVPQQTIASAPPKPQAPPIPFKFYGFITANPNKRAFFMEGEDIHVVREGDVVKNRYRIVRIGVNSVTVEDMQFQSQQTLPLEEQPT
ncbi:MAG TPA: hypothetical protein VER03_17675 [Bryobacteraceae bacterium]|nr:hypothetical protein [Bryobacteraceae bacterium]